MEAPITFRIPISFVRSSAVKAANPYTPRQAIKIAMIVKNVKIWANFFSFNILGFQILCQKKNNQKARSVNLFHVFSKKAMLSGMLPGRNLTAK